MTREFLEINSQKDASRYELKMVFNGLQNSFVRSLILGHTQLFREVYPPRMVNNIYFDSEDFQLRDAHIQGVYERIKIRYRWYHKVWKTSDGKLEIKSKSGNLGIKTTFSVPGEIDLAKHPWKEVQHIISSELNHVIQNQFLMTRPVLINAYLREYFESADRLIRITLDTRLEALDQTFGSYPNLTTQLPIRNVCILELKSDLSRHQYIAAVLEEFPQYCSAYSKYIHSTETILY